MLDNSFLVHHILDEMKTSLSYITSKLGIQSTRNKLSQDEISQLQQRLISTEAQLYKVFNAVNVASNKMNELTKNTNNYLENSQQVNF